MILRTFLVKKRWFSAIIVTLALTTISCGGGDDSSPALSDDGLPVSNICVSGLCLDVSKTNYSKETCVGSASTECKYANVYFTLVKDGQNITDLNEDNVDMKINDRDVGVEGYKILTSDNGLLVSLLLDKSYSITDSGNEIIVKNSALQFIDSLPDEAIVSIATFASEDTVPTLYDSFGETDYYTGHYLSKDEAKYVVEHFYQAYSSPTSDSLTSIYDAVSRWSGFSPKNDSYKLLQKVMILFTDGTDTSSINTPQLTLDHVQSTAPDLKIYAVGLGDGVDFGALNILSSNKSYRASSPEELTKAFDDVSNDLSAIYRLKILVSDQKEEAQGVISLNYDNLNLSAAFELKSYY